MSAPISRALLTLATACMRPEHRAWGVAMEAELEEAIDAGKPFSFAFGCFAAAVARMPMHEEGRFSLTAHAFALGLMIPLAALQIDGTVLGFYRFLGSGSIPATGSVRWILLGNCFQALVPLLAALTLSLGVFHLRMAWVLLQRDWLQVVKAAALSLAAAVSIIILLGLLGLDVGQALLQATLLSIELAVLFLLARWHADLPQPGSAVLSDPPDHTTGSTNTV